MMRKWLVLLHPIVDWDILSGLYCSMLLDGYSNDQQCNVYSNDNKY